jgi:hypothetical protein
MLLCHLQGRKSNSIVERMVDTEQNKIRRHRVEKQLTELFGVAANLQVLCGAGRASLVGLMPLKPITCRRSAIPLNYYMHSASSRIYLLTPWLYVRLRTLTSFTTDVYPSTLFDFCRHEFTLGSRSLLSTTSSHLK